MKHSVHLFGLLAFVILLGLSISRASADDNIFPPAPAAASSISFDGRGFLVHGKRTFIVSGGMEYARIPHQLWRDRLLRMKRDGFNCVEVYTFWDFHEPRPGQFDFSGDHDLDAFLKLAHSLGLYAICRVGPYYCAEWDSGGFPVWLRFVPNLGVRENNPAFLAAVDRFWDHLMPIVAANQINHGGSVILVQLENEHLDGGGTDLPNAYFVHLRDKAVALGLQVPYFFSGLHHGGDPAGNHPWSSAGRTSPWMTTEFWSVNFDRYNQTEADADTYERRTWKVLAYGGNGLNIYMLHGGTNFGYTNNDEDAASYDYGSAIGQAGDLRPTYYRFKRAALFAQSFASVLENSDNATDAYQHAATNPDVHITARTSPSGTILFLDNPGKSAVKTQVKEADGSLFPSAGPLTLTPGQIAPIIRDFPLLPGVTLERSTPLLGIQHNGSTTTLVAYAAPRPVNASDGDAAELRFRLTVPVTENHGGTLKGNLLTVQEPATGGSAVQSSFQVGGQTIRVLTMPSELSDRTWFVDSSVVVGPSYVGDMAAVSGKLGMTTESKTGSPPSRTALVFGTGSQSETTLLPAFESAQLPNAPALSPWQALPGDAEAASSYPDTSWLQSQNAPAMGADSDASAYAWYRTAVSVPAAGAYTLKFTDGGDWASVFINGRHSASAPIKEGVPVTLPAGRSQIAVLAAHYGRPKEFGHMGPIDTLDAKGLLGPVVLDKGNIAGTALTAWRVQANADADHAAPPADTVGAGWTDGTAGPDIFAGRRGYAWYVTTLPQSSGTHHRLHFENVDDSATVFLNGKQVASHQGWGQPFDAPLDAAWIPAGPNTLAVLVQNADGGGGVQGAVTLQVLTAGDEIAVTNWKMHGGIAEPAALTGWKAGAATTANGSPAYFRMTFRGGLPAATGPHPILRVTTTGLSRGFIWLNGHNLGRYPEKIPVNGLYLPEPWLNSGVNTLVVFDEEGHAPSDVSLTVEQAASRFVVPMTEK